MPPALRGTPGGMSEPLSYSSPVLHHPQLPTPDMVSCAQHARITLEGA